VNVPASYVLGVENPWPNLGLRNRFQKCPKIPEALSNFILEKAVEPPKSAEGSKYQPLAALGDITQRVMAHRI
jgi:hypothetical protein